MKTGGRKFWFLLAAVLAGGTVVAARVAFAGGGDEKQQVMAVEQARVAALDGSDVPALERIMADDVTYVHASGKVDTKTSYLDAIRSGKLHYISWAPKNLQVRVEGNAAVINGEYSVRVTDARVQPDPFNIDIFILEMYARRAGRWQQIAWQSTRDVASTPAH
jgi:ketosteroid isomerase-like protein